MDDEAYVGESRLLRQRIASLEDRILRRLAVRAPAAHRLVGQVYSQGAIPTATGRFYACHPVTVTGDEIEGATPTLTADATRSFLVDLIAGTAVAGDYLVCRRVAHRWVATKGATATSFCGLVIPTVSCGGKSIAGATITLTQGTTTIGTGVTTLGVSTVSRTGAGSLYLTAPNVTIGGGGGTGATVVATLGTVAVNAPFSLTNAGTGYTFQPTVTISGGGGTGATATAQHAAAAVTGIDVTNAGAGYTPGTAYAIGFSPPGATGTFDVDAGGHVTNVVVTAGGSYTAWPSISFNAANGGAIITTATARAALAAGALSAIVLGTGGTGYTANPTVTVAPPPSGTTATATVKAGGSVATLRVTAVGTGYTSIPTLTVDPPQSGGTSATGTASIAGCAAIPFPTAGTYSLSGSMTGLVITTRSTGALVCGGSNILLAMSTVAASGYSCSPNSCCPAADQPSAPPYPQITSYPSSLTVTDPFGPIVCTSNGAFPPTYNGSALRPASNPVHDCTGGAATQALVKFQISCTSNGLAPGVSWGVNCGPTMCSAFPGQPCETDQGQPVAGTSYNITGGCSSLAGTFAVYNDDHLSFTSFANEATWDAVYPGTDIGTGHGTNFSVSP